MNKEEIKEMCKLQHKDLCYKILINKMPVGYTNNNVYQLEQDMRIRSLYEKNTEKINEMIEKIGVKKLEETFSDKEIMQQNRFTFDDQRQASKEVFGIELTMEEVFEKYAS